MSLLLTIAGCLLLATIIPAIFQAIIIGVGYIFEKIRLIDRNEA